MTLLNITYEVIFKMAKKYQPFRDSVRFQECGLKTLITVNNKPFQHNIHSHLSLCKWKTECLHNDNLIPANNVNLQIPDDALIVRELVILHI